MAYQIITDTGCDLPETMYQELDLKVAHLSVTYKDNIYTEFSEEFLKELYAGYRAGEKAQTSAVNPEQWQDVIEPVLAAGEDALVLTFSSGLSATYQSAVIAAQELSEKYPERSIRVVDTLCASLGQGLFVYYACQKRNEGLSLDELEQWCIENRGNLCHWFTVDDLMYLKRGGRISSTTAIAGTMLKIKPILHVDDEGHLISVSKTRGRKASIDVLAAKVAELGIEGANDTIFICHGDCEEDAQYLSDLLKEKCGTKNVFYYYTGAVISAHSGPGTLAIFFMGHKR